MSEGEKKQIQNGRPHTKDQFRVEKSFRTIRVEK